MGRIQIRDFALEGFAVFFGGRAARCEKKGRDTEDNNADKRDQLVIEAEKGGGEFARRGHGYFASFSNR